MIDYEDSGFAKKDSYGLGDVVVGTQDDFDRKDKIASFTQQLVSTAKQFEVEENKNSIASLGQSVQTPIETPKQETVSDNDIFEQSNSNEFLQGIADTFGSVANAVGSGFSKVGQALGQEFVDNKGQNFVKWLVDYAGDIGRWGGENNPFEFAGKRKQEEIDMGIKDREYMLNYVDKLYSDFVPLEFSEQELQARSPNEIVARMSYMPSGKQYYVRLKEGNNYDKLAMKALDQDFKNKLAITKLRSQNLNKYASIMKAYNDYGWDTRSIDFIGDEVTGEPDWDAIHAQLKKTNPLFDAKLANKIQVAHIVAASKQESTMPSLKNQYQREVDKFVNQNVGTFTKQFPDKEMARAYLEGQIKKKWTFEKFLDDEPFDPSIITGGGNNEEETTKKKGK